MRISWLATVCLQMVLELAICAPAVLQRSGDDEVGKRATPIASIDFLELKKTCLHRGWYDCYNGLQEIWEKTDSSNPNSTLSVCLASARAYQNTTSVNGTAAASAENCPLSDMIKKIARQKYCDIYSKIGISWQLYIIGQLTNTYGSVSYDASTSALTPGQLRDSLILWSVEMANRHLGDSPCCNSSNFLSLQKRSVRNWCSDEPTPDARRQCLWEKALIDAGATMRTSELLESLGRLQKCLRGCVNLEEVNCSNLLPTTA